MHYLHVTSLYLSLAQSVSPSRSICFSLPLSLFLSYLFPPHFNTLFQWAGSCWYYLRFTDTKNSDEIFGDEGKSWLPVDLYVGGQEHAVLHLLYARFWHKVREPF